MNVFFSVCRRLDKKILEGKTKREKEKCKAVCVKRRANKLFSIEMEGYIQQSTWNNTQSKWARGKYRYVNDVDWTVNKVSYGKSRFLPS